MNKVKRISEASVIILVCSFFVISCESLPEAQLKRAVELRTRAMLYPVEKYAPQDFAEAEKQFEIGTNTFMNKKIKEAKTALESAITNYEKAWTTAMSSFTGETKATVEGMIKSADDIKASVSMAEEYAKVQQLFKDALQAIQASDFEKAAELLASAHDGFSQIVKTVSEKRLKAGQSIEQSTAALAAAGDSADKLKAVLLKEEDSGKSDSENNQSKGEE